MRPLGLPVTRPDPFPQSGLRRARRAGAADDARPAFTRRCSGGVLRGADIADKPSWPMRPPDQLRAGDRPRRRKTELVKHALRKQTDEAEALGIFGAPALVTPDGELFWGNDRLDEALDWAAGRR